MAYIEGKALSAIIREQTLTDGRQIAAIIRPLALALQKAHEKGIVHRDLKPGNVMIDADGEPIVMDFGLARRIDEETRLTQSGALVGSPAYMSPEQIEGKPENIGPAADIYSLGVIMYEVELVGDDNSVQLDKTGFQMTRLGKVVVTARWNQEGLGVVRSFKQTDPVITRDGVTSDEGGWKITADKPRSVRLFEVADPGFDTGPFHYRAKLKTENVQGRAYLEMWVRIPGMGEFFSKGLHTPLSGTNGWAEYEIPFLLKEGQHPDLIKLNVTIEGSGTVWIKDIELRGNVVDELPGDSNDKKDQTPRGAARGAETSRSVDGAVPPINHGPACNASAIACWRSRTACSAACRFSRICCQASARRSRITARAAGLGATAGAATAGAGATAGAAITGREATYARRTAGLAYARRAAGRPTRTPTGPTRTATPAEAVEPARRRIPTAVIIANRFIVLSPFS
jgi:hypothetical protein